MQRNNFLRLIKVIKHLNLCYKVILYYKILNLHAQLLTLISINLKYNELFFLFPTHINNHLIFEYDKYNNNTELKLRIYLYKKFNSPIDFFV